MAMISFSEAARLVAIAILLSVAGLSPSEATKADATSEWCALYDQNGGKRNCSFETLEDCSAAVPFGKWCQLNPLYTSDSHEWEAEPDNASPARQHSSLNAVPPRLSLVVT